MPKWKTRRLEGWQTAESTIFDACVVRRKHNYYKTSVFQFYNERSFVGKLYVTDHASNTVSSCHKISLRFTQVQSVQNNISKSTLHALVHLLAWTVWTPKSTLRGLPTAVIFLFSITGHSLKINEDVSLSMTAIPFFYNICAGQLKQKTKEKPKWWKPLLKIWI